MTSPLRITRDLCFMALISRYGGKPRRHHWSERRWKVHVHQGGYGAVTTVRRMNLKVFGKSFRESCHRVGYVPQRESVDWDFPVSVMDVVLMGRYGRLWLAQRPTKQDREIARESLEKVKMLPFANRQIGNLSGGQQQRVFLARALAQESDLYLMDGPVGVDAATESAIITLLRELKSRGKTLLVVHHDLASAREYFDMLILLNMRLVAFGPTSEVFTPELLQTTYGGRLTILSDVVQTLRTQA